MPTPWVIGPLASGRYRAQVGRPADPAALRLGYQHPASRRRRIACHWCSSPRICVAGPTPLHGALPRQTLCRSATGTRPAATASPQAALHAQVVTRLPSGLSLTLRSSRWEAGRGGRRVAEGAAATAGVSLVHITPWCQRCTSAAGGTGRQRSCCSSLHTSAACAVQQVTPTSLTASHAASSAAWARCWAGAHVRRFTLSEGAPLWHNHHHLQAAHLRSIWVQLGTARGVGA